MHLYYRVHDIYFIKYVNYSHVNFFHKTLQGSEYVRVLNITGFWICLWFWRCQGSKYTRVLNMTLVLKMSGFWKCQGSEYTKVLNKPGFWKCQGPEFAKVLNIPGFWICQGYTGFWICLIMSGCICLDMSEYAEICMNMPKSGWVAFVLYFAIVINLLISTFTQN